MRARLRSEAGITLVETLVAMAILTVGAMAMASVFLAGMKSATASPNELLATQKAAEAVESVFAARDAKTLTWAQLKNVPDGGIFLVGARPMTVAGPDGILNTGDDPPGIEAVSLPGADDLIGTGDDRTVSLEGFTRKITIAPVIDRDDLRVITVAIEYEAGADRRTYILNAYISAFA